MSPAEHEAMSRVLTAYHALEHAVRTQAPEWELAGCLRAIELARAGLRGALDPESESCNV